MQGQIRRLVKEICKKLNIELEENRDSFGGLAYYVQFKKVNKETKRWIINRRRKRKQKEYIAELNVTKKFAIDCIKKM